MDVNKIVKQQLLNIVDDLDSGASQICEDDLNSAMDLLASQADRNCKLSKYQACAYLRNMSRAKFDNLVAEGKLPKGKKQQGFKELFWIKRDLDKYLKNNGK